MAAVSLLNSEGGSFLLSHLKWFMNAYSKTYFSSLIANYCKLLNYCWWEIDWNAVEGITRLHLVIAIESHLPQIL